MDMKSISQQILFLMAWGERFLPQIKELVADPYEYGRILPQGGRAVRRALRRLTVGHYLQKTGNRGGSSYKLSQRGREKVAELWPHFAKASWGKPQWNQKWRVVVFDIPEKYRGLRGVLRRFLKSVGFVGWQRSLWLTPFKIEEEVRAFLEASRLAEMAILMEATNLGMKERELADKAWNLAGLTHRYEELALECKQAEKVTRKIKGYFAKAVFGDPWLPEELLSKDLVKTRSNAIERYGELITNKPQ